MLLATYAQATPRLSEDQVKQCIDPKLKADYPPKAVAKVPLFLHASRIDMNYTNLCNPKVNKNLLC